MTSRDTVRRAIRRHMIDGSQCDRVMNALEPVLAGWDHRLQVAFTKGFEQTKRAQRATDAARIRELKAEVARLKADVGRLRALQAHAISPECAPDLSQVISRFERTHVLWPQLPGVRINPISGPVRRYIHLMAPAITRAALKQAKAQLAQPQEQEAAQ
jgi:Ni,Fe-hydrogenase III large subunit